MILKLTNINVETKEKLFLAVKTISSYNDFFIYVFNIVMHSNLKYIITTIFTLLHRKLIELL
jgi:hypothetical protein